VAADPTADGAARLVALWDRLASDEVLGGSLLGRIGALVRTRTSLHDTTELAQMLADQLPVTTFEELPVHFECVAASVERAAEHWFAAGPLVPAVLASCALPGVFPAVRIDDEHFMDGGLVNSIPIARAVQAGATEVWVLHVGHIEAPLAAPRLPWEVGFVAFEIARRHRFHRDVADIPSGVRVHVLPTGLGDRPASTWSNLRYRDRRRIGDRAARAYEATREFLRALDRTA
jgi:NTE family protein